MTSPSEKTLNVFAPAKINLYLHITGRLQSGYHALDSLVTFADIGDNIKIEPADAFSFHIDGPFSEIFDDMDRRSHLDGNNLVIKAARNLSQVTNKALKLKITLTKNLPLSSGLGGGSSDAAATLWGLQQFWGLPHKAPYMMPLMENLGSDVPVCMDVTPTIMRGRGEVLSRAPTMPEIPILLVNPMVSCPTLDAFLMYSGQHKDNIDLPETFSTIFDLIGFLKQTDNDLYKPATTLAPDVVNVMNALKTQKQCLFSRMSGSGATCFGLFETIEDAEKAHATITQENPYWWSQAGWLNRPERY